MDYVANITTYLEAAGPDEIRRGGSWYRDARAVAESLAEIHGVSVETAAGVLAVISPQMHWVDNVAGARAIMETYAAGGGPYDVRGITAYPENIGKAWRILSDPAFGRPATVCDGTCIGKRGGRVICQPARSGCMAPVHGPKVAAFYHAILGRPDGAVDVWATRAAMIAHGDLEHLAGDDPRRDGDPNAGGRKHGEISAAYAAAGAAYGLAGHEAQAVVWVTIRESYIRADGRRNGRREDLPF